MIWLTDAKNEQKVAVNPKYVIAVFTGTEGEVEGKDYPYDYVRWTENRNMQAIVDLISQKKLLIDKNEHRNIIISAHPSPFSAHRGFFGSNIFKKVDFPVPLAPTRP